MSRPNVNVAVGGPQSPTNYTYRTVVLKSNLPFAEQVQETNCIYVIKWDFDLDGNTMTIPVNCVLKFEGGSLSNGTVVFNNTELSGTVRCFCTIEGTIANKEIYTNWFYKEGDDVFAIINSIIADNKKIIVDNGTYSIEKTITIDKVVDGVSVGIRNLKIDFDDSTIIDNIGSDEWELIDGVMWQSRTIYIKRGEYISIRNLNYRRNSEKPLADGTYIFMIDRTGEYPVKNITFENINAVCDYGEDKTVMFFMVHGDAENVYIRNVNYNGLIPYLFNIEYGSRPQLNGGKHPHNVFVENVRCSNATNSVAILRASGAHNIIYSNCYAENIRSFIQLFSGDNSITRVQGNVIFNNCSCISSEVGNAVNIQTAALSDPGHTEPDPRAYNHQFDFSYIFNNCEFKSLCDKTADIGIRVLDMYSAAKFVGCKISGYYGGFYFTFLEDKINLNNITKFKNIAFENCVFTENHFFGVRQYGATYFERCQFVNSGPVVYYNDGSIIGEASHFKFEDCLFQRDSSTPIGNIYPNHNNEYFLDVRAEPPSEDDPIGSATNHTGLVINCKFVGNVSDKKAINNRNHVSIERCYGSNLTVYAQSYRIGNGTNNQITTYINLKDYTLAFLSSSFSHTYILKGTTEYTLFGVHGDIGDVFEIYVLGGTLTITPNTFGNAIPVYSAQGNNDITIDTKSLVRIRIVEDDGVFYQDNPYIGVLEIVSLS